MTTMADSLADRKSVATTGDLRRIVANSLLALARKEINTSDMEAMAKGLDSVSNSLHAEIRVAKASVELRDKSASLGPVHPLGQLPLGNSADE